MAHAPTRLLPALLAALAATPALGAIPSIDRKYVEAHPYSHCPYFAPQPGGPRLMCVDYSRSNGFARVAVYDVAADAFVAGWMIVEVSGGNDCGAVPYRHSESQAGVAAVSKELAAHPYQPAPVVLRRDTPGAPDLTKSVTLTGGATIGFDEHTVVLWRGTTPIETFHRVASQQSGVPSPVFHVVDLGTHVAIANRHKMEVWAVDPAGPASCPARLHCPPHFDAVREYLMYLCEGILDTAPLMERPQTADAVQRGELAKDDLVYLFNAYSALTGYKFTTLPWLNDFFYDPAAMTWLPPACRFQMKSRPTVDEAHQIRIRNLWRDLH